MASYGSNIESNNKAKLKKPAAIQALHCYHYTVILYEITVFTIFCIYINEYHDANRTFGDWAILSLIAIWTVLLLILFAMSLIVKCKADYTAAEAHAAKHAWNCAASHMWKASLVTLLASIIAVIFTSIVMYYDDNTPNAVLGTSIAVAKERVFINVVFNTILATFVVRLVTLYDQYMGAYKYSNDSTSSSSSNTPKATSIMALNLYHFVVILYEIAVFIIFCIYINEYHDASPTFGNWTILSLVAIWAGLLIILFAMSLAVKYRADAAAAEGGQHKHAWNCAATQLWKASLVTMLASIAAIVFTSIVIHYDESDKTATIFGTSVATAKERILNTVVFGTVLATFIVRLVSLYNQYMGTYKHMNHESRPLTTTAGSSSTRVAF